MKTPKPPKYAYDVLKQRIEILKSTKGNFFLSNQYGMIFLLNDEGEIVLNITALVKKKDRK